MKVNQDGVTLVEIVVALGLLSLAFLGLTSIMQLQSKVEKNAVARTDYISLISLVQSTLSMPGGCKANFADSSEPYQVSQRVDIKSGLYQGNLESGARIATLIKFSPPDQQGIIGRYGSASIREAYLDFPSFIAGQRLYQANLILSVEKSANTQEVLGGKQFRVNPIPVIVYTDPMTGLIVSCNNQPAPAPSLAPQSPPPSGNTTAAGTTSSEPENPPGINPVLIQSYLEQQEKARAPSGSTAVSAATSNTSPSLRGPSTCSCIKGETSTPPTSFSSPQTGPCYPIQFRNCLDPCVDRSAQLQGNREAAISDCTRSCMGEWSCN